MQEPWGSLLDVIAKHWKLLLGILGSSGLLGLVVWFLRPDQQSYLNVLASLDDAAEALDTIVGRPETLERDCDRCRVVAAMRRKAGEEIKAMFGVEGYTPYRRRLSAFDSHMRGLEDAVHEGAGVGPIREASDRASAELSALRFAFRQRAEARLSVRLLGRHRRGA